MTYPLKWVKPLALAKFNKPIVSERKVLPMGARKGIITLTLVISRESKSSAVRRGAFVMFNIFKVKTELELQIEEYVAHKAKTSPFIARDQKEVLTDLMKEVKHKTISEITLEELEAYHSKLLRETTPYTSIKGMEAIRAFFRHHKHKTDIKPYQITNTGIVELQNVVENVIIPQMIKKKKVGRPPNVAFINEVKRLIDKEKLGIRAVARAKLTNPGNVHRAYNYDLSKAI